MHTIDQLVSVLISLGLAEEHTVETNSTVGANTVANSANIVQNDREFVYLPWKESWDAENESNIKFEEFENKTIAASGATRTINVITSAEQDLKQIRVNALYVPIKQSISIRFTNDSGGSLWAKHVWKGVKIRRKVYDIYIKRFVNLMAADLGISERIGDY